jgi:predicted  nucleic acid-binding Zn-ribbon protein
MEKEELLIKRLEANIKEWDIQIAEAEQKIGLSSGEKKNDYEQEIGELSDKIANAKKEIEKLEKKLKS